MKIERDKVQKLRDKWVKRLHCERIEGTTLTNEHEARKRGNEHERNDDQHEEPERLD